MSEVEIDVAEKGPRKWDDLNCSGKFSPECYKTSNFKLSLFFIICSVIVLMVSLYLIYLLWGNIDLESWRPPSINNIVDLIFFPIYIAATILLVAVPVAAVCSVYFIYYFSNDYDNEIVKRLLNYL